MKRPELLAVRIRRDYGDRESPLMSSAIKNTDFCSGERMWPVLRGPSWVFSARIVVDIFPLLDFLSTSCCLCNFERSTAFPFHGIRLKSNWITETIWKTSLLLSGSSSQLCLQTPHRIGRRSMAALREGFVHWDHFSPPFDSWVPSLGRGCLVNFFPLTSDMS